MKKNYLTNKKGNYLSCKVQYWILFEIVFPFHHTDRRNKKIVQKYDKVRLQLIHDNK
jgi:hypothetical protein